MKKFAICLLALLSFAASSWACNPVVAAFVQNACCWQQQIVVQPAFVQTVQVVQPSYAVQAVVVPQFQAQTVCQQAAVQPAFVVGAANACGNGISFNAASGYGSNFSGVRVLNNRGAFGANVAVNAGNRGLFGNRVVIRANAGRVRIPLFQRLFGTRQVVRIRTRG